MAFFPSGLKMFAVAMCLPFCCCDIRLQCCPQTAAHTRRPFLGVVVLADSLAEHGPPVLRHPLRGRDPVAEFFGARLRRDPGLLRFQADRRRDRPGHRPIVPQGRQERTGRIRPRRGRAMESPQSNARTKLTRRKFPRWVPTERPLLSRCRLQFGAGKRRRKGHEQRTARGSGTAWDNRTVSGVVADLPG